MSDAPAGRRSLEDDADARFAALEARPDLPALLERDPAPPAARASELGCGLAFGLLLVALAAALTLGLFVLFPPLALLPPALLVAFAAFAAVQWLRDARAPRAPLVRRPALVLGVRTSLTGLGNLPASTGHFVTLRLPDGSREEVRTSETVAHGLVPGRIGVAYARGGLLLDFQSVEEGARADG